MAVDKGPGLNTLNGVPKQKPLPVPADATATRIRHGNITAARGLPAWTQLSRKKRLIIAIAFAVVCLLALTIGLAVGLTVGRRLTLPIHYSQDKDKRSFIIYLQTSQSSSSHGPYHGDLTYYEPALGSCGIASSSTDMICAISHVLFDAASSGPNATANPLCRLELRLRRNERSVDVKVVDRCMFTLLLLRPVGFVLHVRHR